MYVCEHCKTLITRGEFGIGWTGMVDGSEFCDAHFQPDYRTQGYSVEHTPIPGDDQEMYYPDDDDYTPYNGI